MGFKAMLENQDWQVLTPEIIILLFALLLPILGVRDPDRRAMQQVALVGLGGAFLVTLGSLLHVRWTQAFGLPWLNFDLAYAEQAARPGFALADAFIVTEATQLFKLVFLGVAFLAVLGMGRTFRGPVEKDHGEFFSLLLFATLGMMVVASSRDLFLLFLGIETASLASYLLAGFHRDRVGAEASLKYFTIGAATSGLTLFAISILYGIAGTTHIPTIGQALVAGEGFDAVGTAAGVLLLAGLGFKISSLPSHAWAPDVYCGAPTPVTAVLASASKAMGFVAVFNVFLVALYGVPQHWGLAVGLVAAATMFVGNLVALQQQSVRRMLAYSSIAQAGYVLIAVAVVGALSGTAVSGTYALGGGIFHLLVNAAMKLGAFLVVGALLIAGIPDHMDGYKGLGRRAPFLAIAMALFLLSMAGIPPLGGFASKFVLFSGAVDAGVNAGRPWMVVLAVVAVVNSAISLYYYLRVIRNMYVEEGEPGAMPLKIGAGVTASVAVCLAAVVLSGIMPEPFIRVSLEAAQALLAPAVP